MQKSSGTDVGLASASGGARESLLAIIPGLAEAVRGQNVIDVALAGLTPDDDALGPTLVVPYSVAAPGSDQDGLSQLPGEQSYILVRDTLQRVKDYRRLLQTAFAKLGIDGWLVLTVPHQFLRERKFRRPSRYGESVERFYTPASLLLEVQEALDPVTYRIRLLKDDDSGYDYDTPIDRLPVGHKRIVVALQKIQAPDWADKLQHGDDPRSIMSRPDRVLAVDPLAPVDRHIFQSEGGAPNRIIVLKLDHRGDFVLAGLALRELRTIFASAHITLVCASWNADHARDSGVADDVLTFDFVGEDASADQSLLSPEAASRLFAQVLGDREFSLAIDLSSHEKFRHLLGKIQAKHRAGFDRWNKFPFLDIKLCLPIPSEEGVALQGIMPAADFNSRRGIHKVFAIEVTRTRVPSELGDIVIWGPYISLGAGEYEFQVLIECLGDDQEIGVEVCHSRGSVRLFGAVLSLSKARHPTFTLSLSEHVADLEFRLSAVNNGALNIRFFGVSYRREGAVVGVHQMESMHLLVQLVNARLCLPYGHEVVSA